MCTCWRRGHYYLELGGGWWIASDHWGKEISRHTIKDEVRKLAEAAGYERFR